MNDRVGFFFTRPMCRTGRHITLCRLRVLLVRAGISPPWMFFGGETPPKHAEEPRENVPADLNLPKGLGSGLGGIRVGVRDRVRVRVRVRARPGVGLVWADVQG